MLIYDPPDRGTRVLMRSFTLADVPDAWYWVSLSTSGGTVWLGQFELESNPASNASETFMLMADNTLAYKVKLRKTTDFEGNATLFFSFQQQSDDGTALFRLVLALGSVNIATTLRIVDSTPLLFSDVTNGHQFASGSVARAAIAQSDYDRALPMPFIPIENFPVLPPWLK